MYALYKYTYVSVVMSVGQMDVGLFDGKFVQVPDLSGFAKQTKAVVNGVTFVVGAHFGPEHIFDFVDGCIVLSK